MPLYIAVEEPSGLQRRLNSESQSNVEPIGADESLVIITRFDVEPYPDEQTWKPALRDYEPTVVVPFAGYYGNAMSIGAFMARFGKTRERMVNALKIDPAIPIPVRADIETLYAQLNRRRRVDVTEQETIDGVDELAQLLVFAKQSLARAEGLDPSEVSAFKALMLAPPTAAEV